MIIIISILQTRKLRLNLVDNLYNPVTNKLELELESRQLSLSPAEGHSISSFSRKNLTWNEQTS